MRIKRIYAVFAVVFFLSLASCAPNTVSNKKQIGRKLHSPPQILKIISDSKLSYVIDTLKDSVKTDADSLPVLPNQYYLINSDSGRVIGEYDLHGRALELFVQGETAFKENNLKKALSSFKALIEVKPHYAYAYTLTGDVYYNLQRYDSAAFYFKQALKENPIDYSARWFLADTYWHEGDGLQTLRNITYAHLMNRNNPRLFHALKYYRGKTGKPWSNWKFIPQFRLYKKGPKIIIESAPDWIGYAMVKALWRYEPGYAQAVTGRPRGRAEFILAEEAEAVMALLSANKKMTHIEKIINDGYFTEFFYYEIVSPENPLALLLLPQKQINRLQEYVQRYH